MQYRIDLSNDEVPTKWYNINADLPVELPAPKNSEGKDQIGTLPQIHQYPKRSKGTLPKIRKTYSFS